ncbi:HAUS augmin-like complex subunit 6 N-terminus-domain-containing protein [Dichotomocladium elegans]|nr:HAUS augmin-like complex subunit 6 N-terminus-domain-containing protein [Dichotomocladium elegans]
MDPTPHKTVFLNNLQLLGFHARDHAIGLYEHVVFDENMFSHANNVKAFIATSHFLFTKLNPRRARRVFQTCWPIVEFRRQSREYVTAAFRWLEDLRRDNCLMPNDLVLRKSLFEDCRGQKMETIMMALSTYVLQGKVENLYSKMASTSAMPPIRLLGKDAYRPTSKYAMKKELEVTLVRSQINCRCD